MSKLILLTSRKFFFVFMSTLLIQLVFLLYIDYVISSKYPGIKYLRETHLYMHIVFLVVYALMMHWLYASSKRVDRELMRMAKLAGTSAYNPQRVERILGQFGRHLNDILAQTLQLSEKRRLKIGAQKVLFDVMQEMVEPFLVIVDAGGIVLGHSSVARERLGLELQAGKYLGDIISDFEVKRYVAYFSTQSDTLSLGDYRCYPVYDESGVIHYVFVMDEGYNVQEHVQKSFDHGAQKSKIRRTFLSEENRF
ncbi:hypothetical protein [Entomospira culicis]|uniref:PAS domain-containing protein n=1 Tax=Entomospira culicis TaxID=2719989 RepID=A0A968KW10_9SPIO|nr:hypothetical protein [Entomospira culicis]NIZ18461.1 hypothetical protein [Entomospira culicis]NIZ68677.1 hypothetical protein [Entomospira culicis]WDI37276.1 hypothetical protein PVA46_00355 [Entomospira culicis]WDI38905.1 hypothetical protein PVA47_00365 [Entomospira culicis]